MDRDSAVDRIERLIDRVETGLLPVPVRELWVFGDVALGLDPVERIDLYVRKDLPFATGSSSPDRERAPGEPRGIGSIVDAEWAAAYPDNIRTNANGHVAPEECLAATLIEPDEPIHLEVCNAGFEQNVRQRVEGSAPREAWTEILDPRAVCLWKDGTRSSEAPDRLRNGGYVFPPLAEALEMLGLDNEQATTAATAVQTWRESQEGRSVRGDVL